MQALLSVMRADYMRKLDIEQHKTTSQLLEFVPTFTYNDTSGHLGMVSGGFHYLYNLAESTHWSWAWNQPDIHPQGRRIWLISNHEGIISFGKDPQLLYFSSFNVSKNPTVLW